MKDEIKEIRKYIACPQFGDDHYGQWGALRLDQRIKIKHLLDYITNLQESEAYYYGQYKDYKSRNEKAIEYINEHTLFVNGGIIKDILQGEDKDE